MFNADLTERGDTWNRVPGRIFPFLARVGIPCTIRGARAMFERAEDGEKALGRARVAFGRHEASLPPLTWDEDD
jgi:hypothetical protein